MTNSDYILKAAIKKVTEKLNEILIEKIEEATTIAQDAPEIFKKEINNLKDSILEEATRMEKEEIKKDNTSSKIHQEPKTNEALEKIKEINNQIDKLKIGEITVPIPTPGGFILLKVNDKKNEILKINENEQFKKAVNFEKNRQLTKYSTLHYKRIFNKAVINEF